MSRSSRSTTGTTMSPDPSNTRNSARIISRSATGSQSGSSLADAAEERRQTQREQQHPGGEQGRAEGPADPGAERHDTRQRHADAETAVQDRQPGVAAGHHVARAAHASRSPTASRVATEHHACGDQHRSLDAGRRDWGGRVRPELDACEEVEHELQVRGSRGGADHPAVAHQPEPAPRLGRVRGERRRDLDELLCFVAGVASCVEADPDLVVDLRLVFTHDGHLETRGGPPVDVARVVPGTVFVHRAVFAAEADPSSRRVRPARGRPSGGRREREPAGPPAARSPARPGAPGHAPSRTARTGTWSRP